MQFHGKEKNITRLPGAGGMGEVYRARDSRLERDIAAKVLPPHLLSSAQFRERFEREASYLVMELLEGESGGDGTISVCSWSASTPPVSSEIGIVLNRFEDLKQRVPVGK